ncbi:MAG: O-antigen ligase family protein [Candidatus Marinimicrobia bacterium]|nr:O-antigen ligase family protein [Candidatus Neomarinimicrobiota bacterium]
MIVIIFIQIVLIQLFSYFWVDHYSLHADLIYVKTLSKSLIASTLWFFTGVYLKEIINDPLYRKILRLSWTFLTLFILYNSLVNALRFSIDLGDNLIYLMLADNYAILGIFAVHATRAKTGRHLIFIMSIVTLFALLSRSSLYFFVAIYILFLFRENKKLLMMIMISSFLFVLNASSEVREGRMLVLVFGGQDKSAHMRYDMLMDGVHSIKQNWFTGQFMGDINEYAGTEGYYIHNYLAVWRQYGLIPFIIIISTIIINQYRLGMDWIRSKKLEQEEKLLFYFGMFVIFEITFARSFMHPYIWMTFVPALVYSKARFKAESSK